MHRRELAEALLFFIGFYLLSQVTQRWPSLRRAVRYRGSRDWPIAQATLQSPRIEGAILACGRAIRPSWNIPTALAGGPTSDTSKATSCTLRGMLSGFWNAILQRYPCSCASILRNLKTQCWFSQRSSKQSPESCRAIIHQSYSGDSMRFEGLPGLDQRLQA